MCHNHNKIFTFTVLLGVFFSVQQIMLKCLFWFGKCYIHTGHFCPLEG